MYSRGIPPLRGNGDPTPTPQPYNVTVRGGNGGWAPVLTHLMACGFGFLLCAVLFMWLPQQLAGLLGVNIRTETVKPMVIKASTAEKVNMTISAKSTTEIDETKARLLHLPLVGDLTVNKKRVRGNGACLVGSDNSRSKPYFVDKDGRKKDTASADEKGLTLWIQDPNPLLCGIYQAGFDGLSADVIVNRPPDSFYNALLGESINQAKCAGQTEVVLNQAREAARQNIHDTYADIGADVKVEFKPREQPPEISGTPAPAPDPSVKIDRPCDPQAPPPQIAPTPTPTRR